MFQGQREREFTGKDMLFLMVGFFAVIIAVNAVLAYFASRSWTGLIVDNSYVESQRFNQILETAERQKELGWASSLSRETNHLILTVRDKDGRPLDDLTIQAIARRPTHENDDQALVFKGALDGAYRSEFKLRPGLWNLTVIANNSYGQTYKQIFRLNIAEDR